MLAAARSACMSGAAASHAWGRLAARFVAALARCRPLRGAQRLALPRHHVLRTLACCADIYGTKVVDITSYIANDLHPGTACCFVVFSCLALRWEMVVPPSWLSSLNHWLLCYQSLLCGCPARLRSRPGAYLHLPCGRNNIFSLCTARLLCAHTAGLLTRSAGGNDIMFPCCGKDCTKDFDDEHRGQRAHREQAAYYIGDLAA